MTREEFLALPKNCDDGSIKVYVSSNINKSINEFGGAKEMDEMAKTGLPYEYLRRDFMNEGVVLRYNRYRSFIFHKDDIFINLQKDDYEDCPKKFSIEDLVKEKSFFRK